MRAYIIVAGRQPYRSGVGLSDTLDFGGGPLIGRDMAEAWRAAGRALVDRVAEPMATVGGAWRAPARYEWSGRALMIGFEILGMARIRLSGFG